MKKLAPKAPKRKARVRTAEEDAVEHDERAASLRAHDVGFYVGAGLTPRKGQRNAHVAELLRSTGALCWWAIATIEIAAEQQVQVNWEAVRKRLALRAIECVLVLGLSPEDPVAAFDHLSLRLAKINLADLAAEDLARWALASCGVDANQAGKWIEHAQSAHSRRGSPSKAMPLITQTPGGIGPLGAVTHLWTKSKISP